MAVEAHKVPIAILISGRGSNMVALVDAMQAGQVAGDPVLVLSNRPNAAGLAAAQTRGVSTAVVDHTDFADREAFEHAVDEALGAAGAQWVCLAGFMRVLTPWLVRRWEGRMLNIHPSLLPKHPGLNTHARALAAGDTTHGCTVHWVTEGVDAGPILAQAEVPVLPGDTAETLAARVLAEEHALYPQALAEALAASPARSRGRSPISTM